MEKTLGLGGKKEVEAYGIEAFNQLCRDSVSEYISEWEAMTERMGFLVDTDNPYVTYQNWTGIMKGSLEAIFEKDGQPMIHRLALDRCHSAPDGTDPVCQAGIFKCPPSTAMRCILIG